MHSHQQSRPALNPAGRFSAILLLYSLCVTQAEAAEAVFPSEVPLFARLEVSLDAKGSYSNPYVEVAAEATLIEPNGGSRCQVPLFWDGGSTWRFRFSPDKPGLWRWSVSSGDAGLNGREGRFECVPSELRGGLQPAAGWPAHFQHQNGEHVWFLGDTAWAYGQDNDEEHLHRASAERYAANRAQQGFNAIHMMLLSELGWGNNGGPPWRDLSAEKINPDYFREVDKRIAWANEQGLSASMKTNNHECKSHPANYVIQPATTGNCVPVREGGKQPDNEKDSP